MESVADPWSDPAVARRILRSFRTWAIVGCSSDPTRASYGVSRYLLAQGYAVVPINPNEEAVHGKPAYPDLASVPADPRAPIEVVDLFRRPDAVLPHVEEAIAIGARAVWMQLGVWNQEAAELAAHAGLLVVMNRCPAIDHPAMIGSRALVPEPYIRRARAGEADLLTALARRAKAHWGYPPELLERFAVDLVLTEEAIAGDEVWVLDGEAGPIGFHRVVIGAPAVLEDLWLEPAAIGAGHGRRLWLHAADIARKAGAAAIELDADPNAIGFYERMGAHHVGDTPSAVVPGRTLPRMRADLE